MRKMVLGKRKGSSRKSPLKILSKERRGDKKYAQDIEEDFFVFVQMGHGPLFQILSL
jgi:hypothetical protein